MPGEDVSSSDALHAVLFDSGRPVLISPQSRAGDDRHAHLPGLERHRRSPPPRCCAALPWMQRAEAVRILSADGYQRRGPAAPELAAYLALHGVARGHRDVPVRSTARSAPACWRRRASSAATCCAMGAYSHSRLRQLILGGVTRHVLENADLPVMMNR